MAMSYSYELQARVYDAWKAGTAPKKLTNAQTLHLLLASSNNIQGVSMKITAGYLACLLAAVLPLGAWTIQTSTNIALNTQALHQVSESIQELKKAISDTER